MPHLLIQLCMTPLVFIVRKNSRHPTHLSSIESCLLGHNLSSNEKFHHKKPVNSMQISKSFLIKLVAEKNSTPTSLHSMIKCKLAKSLKDNCKHVLTRMISKTIIEGSLQNIARIMHYNFPVDDNNWSHKSCACSGAD